ncbi:MAG: phospho-N-acetylmuramoyl-pentapeptide-transferase [Verrucomicrobiae bacterium]|nr:phospho-N-acetylmuramoyl-pentapeptide-transferase [Verrucomicrobiae bacterium]MCP5542035.1 phospho-N-acetylmuramoyl-pentapeptide-transferase [Akkermansiaceae bacterium]MCP5551857.1 phospho-N-acetylmuramoyl-pentapeptide-transferase [Akkermansiaceae bacterium]
MLYYLSEFTEHLDVLNVFRYGTFRAAGACLTAFLLCLFFGERVILRLTELKIGQPIRTADEVHKLAELHGGKGGTPTMGGILIVGAVVISVALWAIPTNPFIWALTFVTLGTGFLGFMDDYRKVTRKNSAGVSGRVKLVAQFSIALIAVLFLYLYDHESHGIVRPGELRDELGHPLTVSLFTRQLFVPFLKTPVIQDMGVFAVIFLPIVIVGCSNAVNLTDGLDGLATGCTLTTAAAYAVFTYLAGHSVAAGYLFLPHHPLVGETSVFCTALLGAGLGFLWFNCHPARVFMGDTGSLAIGGMLGMIAICCKQEILLIIVGGVFVIEALSVILQVASFKLTRKRIFKMAPIHHHFELIGWKESKVITRFWIVSILFALVGIATLKLR